MLRGLIPRRRSEAVARQDPIQSFRSEVDRLFDDFLGGGSGVEFPSWSGVSFVPEFDLVESDTEIRIAADLPGVEEKDLELSLDGDVLTIRGERRAEKEERRKGYEWSERRFGSFLRRIELPSEVQSEKVQAKFNKGVLEITLPKSESAKRKSLTIPIQSK